MLYRTFDASALKRLKIMNKDIRTRKKSMYKTIYATTNEKFIF